MTALHKIDYDLFILDPENPDTMDYQYKECLYDAIRTLNQRVENLESALDTQARVNRMLVDAIDNIAGEFDEEE